jgi:hypothetical protein
MLSHRLFDPVTIRHISPIPNIDSEPPHRKFRVEHAVAKSYTRKCANISPYMRRPLVIYDFATAPL